MRCMIHDTVCMRAVNSPSFPQFLPVISNSESDAIQYNIKTAKFRN